MDAVHFQQQQAVVERNLATNAGALVPVLQRCPQLVLSEIAIVHRIPLSARALTHQIHVICMTDGMVSHAMIPLFSAILPLLYFLSQLLICDALIMCTVHCHHAYVLQNRRRPCEVLRRDKT